MTSCVISVHLQIYKTGKEIKISGVTVPKMKIGACRSEIGSFVEYSPLLVLLVMIEKEIAVCQVKVIPPPAHFVRHQMEL